MNILISRYQDNEVQAVLYEKIDSGAWELTSKIIDI